MGTLSALIVSCSIMGGCNSPYCAVRLPVLVARPVIVAQAPVCTVCETQTCKTEVCADTTVMVAPLVTRRPIVYRERLRRVWFPRLRYGGNCCY